MSEILTVPASVCANAVLDAKDLSCPIPLLRAKKEITKLSTDEILQVDATDPRSRNDLPGWCQRSKHEYLGEQQHSRHISFFIKKGKI